jgi:hypothetical protein
VDPATAKSAALLRQTRWHRKEIAERELNERITRLNEAVERGRLDQGVLRGEVAAQREGPRRC